MNAKLLAAALAALAGAASADELSAADRLRVVYSNQFAWTQDGLPLVTVRVAEDVAEVAVRPAGGAVLRLLPDGEGGPEVRGHGGWTVRVSSPKPARLKWRVVVWQGTPADLAPHGGAAAPIEAEETRWRERALPARRVELGALFAVRGQLLDSRRELLAVGDHDSEAAAQKQAEQLKSRYGVVASLRADLEERPHGVLEASDEGGASVRSTDIVWLATTSGVMEIAGSPVAGVNGAKAAAGRYFGALYVTLNTHGRLTVVNAVPEDKLLAGLVPSEMLPSAPAEALKAQAVAARGELLAKLGTRHLTDPYRLCATTHCQVYGGAGREDPRATAAVTATRGELLVAQRPEGAIALIDTVYSASCGGHSENNDLVWGGAPDPALRGVVDGDEAAVKAWGPEQGGLDDARTRTALEDVSARAYCGRPKSALTSFRWTTAIDGALLADRAGVGPLREVTALGRGVSGRILALRLIGERGTKEVRGELEVRRLLAPAGSALLKSSMAVFDAEREGGVIRKLVIKGGGHGHGAGMCQNGAMGMAESGLSYKDILRHYYRGAEVKKLY